jgi:hypothetical protein
MIRKRAMIPILLFSSTAAAKPPPDDQAPKPLIELRGKLFSAGEANALADVPKFRPLCDAEGYPLVGNMIRKSNVYQPSAFCAVVRARERKA